MPNNKIKVIVFDLGNVLVPFDFQIAFDALNKIERGLGTKFSEKYFGNFHFHENFETAKISLEEFTSQMLTWLDHKITAEKFYHIYSEIFTLNERMISLLPKLKGNYKLILLSNTNEIHQKFGWQKYNFIKQFDHLILSHEIGARKPQIEIFRAVEEASGEPSSNHFFTDDISDYVETAKSIGWDGVVYKNYDDFVSHLYSKSIL